MRVPGVKTVRRVAGRLTAGVRGGGLILGYHRVAASSWDPFGLGVDPERFAQQMEVLARHTRPLALEELLDVRRRRAARRRAVALTFDDGYAECLTEVAPILERHGVPATIFAISRAPGHEPWWERLARLLSPSRELPAPPEIEIEGRRFAVGDGDGVAARVELARAIHRDLAPRLPDRRKRLLDRLAEALGVPRDAPPEHRTLTAEELRRLAVAEQVTVGAHGHSHVPLAGLPAAERRREIHSCKHALEEILGADVIGFSYPHGSVDGSARDEVRQAGYAYACCSRSGVVHSSNDVFRLPRVWAPDTDGDRFHRWLRGWIGR